MDQKSLENTVGEFLSLNLELNMLIESFLSYVDFQSFFMKTALLAQFCRLYL